MMARRFPAARAVPVLAVGLGLGHAAIVGGLSTPTAFTRAVLAVGVLCPLMMAQRSSRIGSIILRPRLGWLPLLVSLGLGPALAMVLGGLLLSSHPEQASALLILSLLPGSALAPMWAKGTGACEGTVVALALLGWSCAALVGLPLLADSLAPGATFIAFRDLALLGVLPLAAGSLARVVLVDALGAEEYARSVEPARKTVVEASLSVLLFASLSSDRIARMLGAWDGSMCAFAAVLLLQFGLVVACGGTAIALRRRLGGAAASAAVQVAVTRQTALAVSLLPLAVAPAALESALRVPLFALVVEIVLGTAALSLFGAGRRVPRGDQAGGRRGCPSILPD
ncbi:MAG: hypothetical protein JW751_07215 [Polyangiaceae bacterium]|nr:hypothetical protein [Polyangiaceae bacterium]